MAAVVRDLHFPKFRNFEHFPNIETLPLHFIPWHPFTHPLTEMFPRTLAPPL